MYNRRRMGGCRAYLLVFICITQPFAVSLFAQPRVSQFSPVSGPIGTVATITGTGFSANAAADIVYFGATRATVSGASANLLTVLVPPGATYQPISVTVNNLTGYSAAPFLVTYPGGQPFTQTLGSSQQDAFEPEIDSSTDLHPNGVAIADFDGDGRPDIATANNYSITGQPASITLLRNTGSIARISFAPRYDMPADVQIYAIAAGDLDGDGKPDLVSSSVTNETISVFRNISSPGTISFAPKIDFPSGHDPFSITIADIDLDGRPDVILVNYFSGTLSIYRNTSSGGAISLATPINITVGLGPQCVAAGDLDGDGKVDLVVSNELSNTLSVLRNTSTVGSISFATPSSLPTNANPNGVAIGDLDGDNKPDIVVVNNGTSNYSIFQNTSNSGSISFAAHIDFGCGYSPYGVALGDLNGDGKPDIFISSANATVTQNASTPGKIALGGQIYLYPRFPAFGIGIADLDGDGKSDLVSPSFSADKIAFLRNKDNEPTILYFNPVNAVAGSVVTIVGHHFDGVTGVNFGGVPAASYTIVDPGTIQATVGTGASGSLGVSNSYGTNQLAGFFFHAPPVITQFTPARAGRHDTIRLSGSYFTGASAVSFGGMAAASFVVNSDSSITAVVDSGSTGSIQVTTSYGSGALAGFTYYHIPVITQFTPVSGASGTTITITGNYFVEVSAVTIGGVGPASYTVNSPTSITVVVAEGGSGYLAVTSPGGMGLSDTTFAFPPPTISGISPDPAAVGASVTITGANFRSDPSTDVVYFGAAKAVVTSASTTSLTVTVPPGATYDPVSVSVNNRTAQTIQPFIATYAPGSSPFTDSSFVWRGAFPAGENPEEVALADLDGDGKPDIITVNGTLGQVSVLKNSSTINNPSFAHVLNLPPAGGVTNFPGMTVGDINGDGKPDLVIFGTNYFSVYINTSSNGRISFAGEQDFPTAYLTKGIALADFDGDGRVDIAVSTAAFNATQSILSIYRNTGDGTRLSFAPSVDYSDGYIYFRTLTADFDKDGRPDIATVSDQLIHVYRNTSSPGTISFSLAGQFPSNLSQTCTIADVDGDGLQDLISEGANNQANTQVLSVLKNTSSPGSVRFNPKINLAYPGQMYNTYIYPTAAQLDGDGKPDLVMVDAEAVNNHPLAVYRNTSSNGNISFTGGNQYSSPLTYGYARHGAAGDVDGDGKPDIVMTNDVDNYVSVFRNQSGESILTLCASSDTGIVAGKTGSAYQWQVATGGAFVNLAGDANYSGVGSAALRLHSIPARFNHYQYRCLVDGVPGTVTDLVVNPDTLLAGTASAPAQACSGDTITVTFTAGGTVPMNAGVQLWASTDKGTYAVAGQKAYAGVPLTFAVGDSAAAGVSYFFHILPPAGVSACTMGANSDTVATAVTRLVKPVVTQTGNILQITNPDASESYTWQHLDSSGTWRTGVNGVTDTLTQSGVYRVQGTKSSCQISSDTLRYSKPVVSVTLPADSATVRSYPNPANGVFILDSLNLSDDWSTLELIHATDGRRIRILSIVGQTRITLSVANLDAGIYVVVLRRRRGGPVVIRFLKV